MVVVVVVFIVVVVVVVVVATANACKFNTITVSGIEIVRVPADEQ